jgi:hypothetical protein
LPKHQRAVDRIRATITPPPSTAVTFVPAMGAGTKGEADSTGCSCVHLADVYIHFPDGSLKRPDIAIFCREPDEDDTAITLVPEAVIEVISRGYEAKDLEIGLRFYLSQGVQDVVVFDPYTFICCKSKICRVLMLVLHIHAGGAARHISPVTIQLQCGCRCVV